MGLFKKGSLSWAIYHMKCPKCRVGNLFPTSTFSFQQSFDMPKKCPACNQKYFPEPGFYYGAMFISYIITAFMCLGIMGTLMLGFGVNVYSSFAILFVICAILYIWMFRISRTLWITIRVRFNPKTSARVQAEQNSKS